GRLNVSRLPGRHSGSLPAALWTAGSVRPPKTRKRKDAAWRAGKTRTHASCASGSRRSGPARENGPVWRNPGHAPSRRATPLMGRKIKRRATPKPEQTWGRDRLAVWQVNGPQGGLAKRNPPIAVKRRNKLRYRAWPSPISLRSMRATLPSPRDGRRYFAEVQSTYNSESSFVMAGLVPAIHVLLTWGRKTWMPATSAGMTRRDSSKLTLSS